MYDIETCASPVEVVSLFQMEWVKNRVCSKAEDQGSKVTYSRSNNHINKCLFDNPLTDFPIYFL